MPTDSILSSLLSIHKLLQRHERAGSDLTDQARKRISDAYNRIYSLAVRAVRAETTDFNLERTLLGREIGSSLADIEEYLKRNFQASIDHDAVISVVDVVLEMLEGSFSPEFVQGNEVEAGSIPKLQDILRKNENGYSVRDCRFKG